MVGYPPICFRLIGLPIIHPMCVPHELQLLQFLNIFLTPSHILCSSPFNKFYPSIFSPILQNILSFRNNLPIEIRWSKTLTVFRCSIFYVNDCICQSLFLCNNWHINEPCSGSQKREQRLLLFYRCYIIFRDPSHPICGRYTALHRAEGQRYYTKAERMLPFRPQLVRGEWPCPQSR